MLFILLGIGKATDKAHQLFRQWDVNGDKELARDEMKEITNTLKNIFIDAYVEYAINEESANADAVALLTKYQEDLNERADAAAEALMKLVFPNEDVENVPEAQFIQVIGAEHPDLTTSFGYRQFVMSQTPA